MSVRRQPLTSGYFSLFCVQWEEVEVWQPSILYNYWCFFETGLKDVSSSGSDIGHLGFLQKRMMQPSLSLYFQSYIRNSVINLINLINL